MSPSFADLRLITTASECLQNSTWSMHSISCDPWGRPFNYPSMWVHIFAFLHIVESQTHIIGLLEIVILVASLTYWLRRALSLVSDRHVWTLLLVFLIFIFSPPVFLLVERGNVDILIFAGLTVAAELIQRKAFMFSAVLIVILGALKIYPFAGILIPIFAVSRKLKRASIVVLACIGVFAISAELGLISSRSITSWNSISYGMSIIPLVLFQKFHLSSSREMASLFGLILLLIMSLVIWKYGRKVIRHVSNQISLSRDSNLSFQLFALVFLLSYLVGTSFDYRLVISMPLFVISFAVLPSNRARSVIVICLIASLYGGHLMAGFGSVGVVLNTLSDSVILLMASLLSLVLMQLSLPRIESKE